MPFRTIIKVARHLVACNVYYEAVLIKNNYAGLNNTALMQIQGLFKLHTQQDVSFAVVCSLQKSLFHHWCAVQTLSVLLSAAQI